MKKIIVLIILIIVVMSLQKEKKEQSEIRGIYISYIEISNYLKDKDEKTSKENINQIISNIKNMNLNMILLQVRPSMDAIYPSKIFPISKYLSDDGTYSYDVLEYFIEESHKNNIQIIAWINPYRVSTTGTKKEINKNSPVYPYIETDIVYENDGVYLNPARRETEELIIKGVNELLEYKIDGILMDDYFYPSDEIDEIEYNNYINNNNPFMEKEEFHLQVINQMIKKVHDACKKKNILFGVSPEGNIENNYEKNYADVKTWLSSKEYVDFIMPQLYYGFKNETKPFIETANEWNSLIQEDIPLYPVLAFYKVGNIDIYAKSGKEEWIENDNIITKEIIHSRNLSHYKGFILYRYDNLFTEEKYTKNSKTEIKNLKKIINSTTT